MTEEVPRRAGLEREFASIVDQRILRWFGQVERMDEYRIPKRVLMAEESGGRVLGRQRIKIIGNSVDLTIEILQ